MAANRAQGPFRGEVVMVQLDPTIGHEQGGQRPALVVSDDSLNRSPAGLVIVAPITGTDRSIPAHVRVDAPEAGLTKASLVMTDRIRTISRRRIVRRIGAVTADTMGRVDDRLRLILGLH